MKFFSLLFILLTLSTINSLPSQAQSLAEIARREREKRERQKLPSKVYTNEDLGKFETESEALAPTGEGSSQPESPELGRFKSEPASPYEEEERVWSKRFIEAKTKLQEA